MDKDLVLRFRAIEPGRLTLFGSSDASKDNAKENGTQAGYALFFCEKGLYKGEISKMSMMNWKSYRLRRAAGSTMSGETQACKDCVGHLVFALNMLAEAQGGEKYQLLRRNELLTKYGAGVAIDCKSLYDLTVSLGTPTASTSDRFTAVDVTILKEVEKQSGVTVMWTPGSLQIADGLTKNKEEPALRLRGFMREAAFELAEAGEVLRTNRLEKERKERLKTENTARHEALQKQLQIVKAAKKLLMEKDDGKDPKLGKLAEKMREESR